MDIGVTVLILLTSIILIGFGISGVLYYRDKRNESYRRGGYININRNSPNGRYFINIYRTVLNEDKKASKRTDQKKGSPT